MTSSRQVQDASALNLEPLKTLIEERVRIPCLDATIEQEARAWRLSQMLTVFLLISLVVGAGIAFVSGLTCSWMVVVAMAVVASLFLTYAFYLFKVKSARTELRERVSSPIDVLLGYYLEKLGRYRADLISGDGWLATIKKGRPYEDTLPPAFVKQHSILCERCDQLIRRLRLLIEPCEERVGMLKSALRVWAKAPLDQQEQAWAYVATTCRQLDKELRLVRAVWIAAKHKSEMMVAITIQPYRFLEVIEDALNTRSESLPPDAR